MAWNTNISEAPRGRTVLKAKPDGKSGGEVQFSVFEPTAVILTTKCDQSIKSQWLPKHKVGEHPPREIAGRWLGLRNGEQPVAWQPWPEPYEAE